MSRWSLGKKLSPAKKAWKSFTTRLPPKLIKLIKHSIPQAIKTTSRRLLYSLHSFLPTKLRTISNPYYNSSSRYRQSSTTYYYNNHNSRPINKSFAAIHIDELFASTPAEPALISAATTKNTHNNKTSNIGRYSNNNMHADKAGTSGNDDKGKRVVEDDHDHHVKDMKRMSSKSIYSVEDAWMAVVASSPQLRGVDERAEEFISNFRRDMELQKEKSILEFQEMLLRSA